MRALRSSTMLLAFVAAGCATSVHYDPPMPYTAVEARIDGTSLQVKYLSSEGLVYCDSAWPEELRAAAPSTEHRTSLYLLTPIAIGRQPHDGRLAGRRIPLLGPAEYERVRSALIEAAAPIEQDSATVVQALGEDVVLYIDDSGRCRSVIGEPPDGVTVAERLPLEEYLDARTGVLARVLDQEGITSREVLFNTGDTGDEALPFMYANADTSTAAFIRVHPLGAPAANGVGPITPITRSLTHVVKSHTIGLLNRPVSSVFRLVFVVTDAVRDTFDPVWTLALESAEIKPLGNDAGMDLTEWEAEIDRMTGRSSSTGTVAYLVDGEAFFTRLEQAVREARESVAVRTYIFDNDDYAIRFADLLRERGDAGVEVRVLMDGFGTLAAGTDPPAGLPNDHESPASVQRYLSNGSEIDVRTVLNPFFTGDHTKTIVVDDDVAFLGGMNIGREYRYEWHDMMVELGGPVVAEIADDFDLAWAGAGFMGDLREFLVRISPGRTPGPPEGYPIRVLHTRPTKSEIRNVQLAAIRRARSYIYLQNAYFTDDSFLHELVRARRRGVDVRVIVPLQSDRGVLARDNVLAANVMFRNGIRVYIYPGMSHIKAAVYDGWACLGSANVDQLSLRVNREANIATSAPEAVQPLLESVFEADFRASPEMEREFPTYWHDVLWELVGDYVF